MTDLDPDTTVYLPAGGEDRVFHTDPQCGYIRNADSVRETTVAALANQRTHCAAYAGSAAKVGHGPSAQHRLLSRADPDDLDDLLSEGRRRAQ